MAANVLVGEIALSALGLICNIAGCFLGFMTICCGPWKVCWPFTIPFLKEVNTACVRTVFPGFQDDDIGNAMFDPVSTWI